MAHSSETIVVWFSEWENLVKFPHELSINGAFALPLLPQRQMLEPW